MRDDGPPSEHADLNGRKSCAASLPRRLRTVCKQVCGSPLKVRLRLTDQVTSQLIVDAVRKSTERSTISRHAEPAAAGRHRCGESRSNEYGFGAGVRGGSASRNPP